MSYIRAYEDFIPHCYKKTVLKGLSQAKTASNDGLGRRLARKDVEFDEQRHDFTVVEMLQVQEKETKKKLDGCTSQNKDSKQAEKKEWTELEVVGSVRNISPKLWTFTNLVALYLNDNKLTRLPAEISRLNKLQKLELSRNKLRTLPVEVGDMTELRELNLNGNLLRILPNELGRLFQLKALGLQGNPLPTDLLSLVEESNGVENLRNLLLDNVTVCPRPPDRPWLTMETESSKDGYNFTVMSYNILFDKYCTSQLYGYCPSWALNWDYRKTEILKEIIQYHADILSLQEIGTDAFHNLFLPELSKNGYDGIFSPKSRAKTMPEEERGWVDGCAIFWHTSKFRLIKEHLVEFNQLAAAHAERSEDMLNRVMPRDNIGIMAMLETVEPGVKQKLVVTNAHIHWDPEFKDVKLIQVVMLMRELTKFMQEVSPSYNQSGKGKNGITNHPNIPSLICADLNSLPGSGVMEYLSNSKISIDHPDFQHMSYGGFLSKYAGNENGRKTNELSHLYELKRAYAGEELTFTNFTYHFTGMLDYIFYTSDSLAQLGELGSIPEDYFKRNKIIGFPHPHFPSDHLPLLVEFEFRSSSLQASQPTRNGPSSYQR